MLKYFSYKLANLWWSSHCQSEYPQNIWQNDSPPFPSFYYFLGFIISCLCYPFFIHFLLSYSFFYSSYFHEFIVWFGLLIIEFIYINYIITERLSFIRGRHGTFRDFIIVCILSFLAFLGGPYLHNDPPNLFSNINSKILYFLIPFILMSHCSYLHRLPHEYYASMNHKQIKQTTTSLKGIIILLVRIVPILSLAFLRFKHMFIYERYYFFAHIFVLALIYLITFLISKHYYIHIHHYIIGAFFLFASGYYSSEYDPSIIGYAFCSAAFVEGSARWSCAPLWHKR